MLKENKELCTSKEDVFFLLDLFEKLGVKYWLEGGWGVDVLLGRQMREHRDVDIDFDGIYIEAVLQELQKNGYIITTDWRPCRIELMHREKGYVDIHPLELQKDGSAMQRNPFGEPFVFQKEYFSCSAFDGREIPCISAEAQLEFHRGYELTEKDIVDVKRIQMLLS